MAVRETRATTADRHDSTLLQRGTLAVGAAFLLVGILGFIPGITENADDLGFAGSDGGQLLGIFEVNTLHNIVHIATGLAGIAASRRFDWSRLFLTTMVAVYAVVTVYGFVVDRDADANFLALDNADNWLHVALTLGMLAILLLFGRERDARTARVA